MYLQGVEDVRHVVEDHIHVFALLIFRSEILLGDYHLLSVRLLLNISTEARRFVVFHDRLVVLVLH